MPTNYKQNDSRWAAYPYAGENMAAAGCGPTAVADLLNKLPTEIADWMSGHGYASNGSGTYQSGITACIRAYGYQCNQVTSSSRAGLMNDASFETFKQSVQSGNCGILLMGGEKTDCRNSYWSKAGHYIAVVGYENGKYKVYDPAWDARDGLHNWYDFQGNIKHIYTTNIKWSNGSSTGGNKFMFSVDQIQYGSKGSDVLLIQEILKARGLYKGELDRIYGNQTKEAVKAYQQARVNQGAKLAIDGICGPNTWRDILVK